MAVRHNIVAYQNAGCEVKELRVAGGPAKSEVWMQILADVTGHEIIVPMVTDAGPIGDAILAGAAAGYYEDVADVLKRTVHIGARYSPQIKNKELYDSLFRIYIGIYPKLKDDFLAISQL